MMRALDDKGAFAFTASGINLGPTADLSGDGDNRILVIILGSSYLSLFLLSL